MNRGTGFYPWLTDWHVIVAIIVGGLILVLGLYAAMRQGRLESDARDDDKEHIDHYAGIIEGGHRKPTVFVIILSIVLVIWMIGYVANIAINGLGY
ncbi:MAG TPA: hypothetical protein VGM51_03115 [Armatimonadota bacterium]